MSNGYYKVNAQLMRSIYTTLVLAKDNAIEAYNSNINKLGDYPMTVKDINLSSELKNDIDRIDNLIKELNNKHGL